ncbi:MAG: hypothetical protein L0221_16095, partial [Chloroflexi bacterium]|nr:hypothetical protein [Chloroflexota bacterium]
MRSFLLLGLASVALVAAACGGSGKPSGSGSNASGSGEIVTLPRPAVFADLATVELVAPGRADAGAAPTFEWRSVSGAAAYRLFVLASDGPTWAWTGSSTSVRYGGVEAGVPGPALKAGSWWSVAALGSDDAVIAMSELRAVSPGSDLGPDPEWTSVQPTTSDSSAEPDSGGGTMGERICDLLSPDEITASIQGDWDAGDPTTYPTGRTGSCDWTSVNGSKLSVSVLNAETYDPAGWNSDGDLSDLGEKAFWAKS